jgi:hypothetical protein
MRLSWTRLDAGAQVRFRLDRRWAMLVVAVVLGAIGGSTLGFVTAPGPSGGAAEQVAPPGAAVAPTTRRPRKRVAGTSSTRPRARALPAPITSTARPTTTTAARTTSTTRRPTTTSTTTTTTVGQDTTSTTTTSTLASSSTTTSTT